MPTVNGIVPVLDPDEAHQRALGAGLVVQRANPLNCEAAIPALTGGGVTPNARFYVRNHFAIPALDSSSWRLQVSGLVERPLRLSLPELRAMRSQTSTLLLECAGNGRSMLVPAVDGEQWGLGAVSAAEWTGVPLVAVLDQAGITPGAREVVFRGADAGTVEGRPEIIRYERSLTLAEARDSGALLAYAMNGAPLPPEHGFPLRVVVPGWYGVTSVKWLSAIEVIAGAFGGFFQADRYFYEWERNGRIVREPLNLQRVRALITEPGGDQEVERGALTVRGLAWAGAVAIARVEVRIGAGPWREAQLNGDRNPTSWQAWELITRVEHPGPSAVQARATDRAGRTQPELPQWNRLGYGSNAIQEVRFRVR